MRYLAWLSRIVLFLLLLGFAVKNGQPVVLRYFFGLEWQASLVVILLLFFAVGVATGALAVLGNVFRQSREIAALRKEVRRKKAVTDEAVTSDE